MYDEDGYFLNKTWHLYFNKDLRTLLHCLYFTVIEVKQSGNVCWLEGIQSLIIALL